MSQQQPGYPPPGQQPPSPGQPGAYPTPSQGYSAPGYAQPAQQPAPQQPQPPQQPWGAQPPQQGAPQQGYAGGYAPPQRTEPGFFGRLFDTTFAHLVAPKHVSGAYVVVYVVAGIVTLQGLVGGIDLLSLGTSVYGGVGSILGGLVQIIAAPVLGLAVLLIGRLALEAVVHLAKAGSAAEAQDSTQE